MHKVFHLKDSGYLDWIWIFAWINWLALNMRVWMSIRIVSLSEDKCEEGGPDKTNQKHCIHLYFALSDERWVISLLTLYKVPPHLYQTNKWTNNIRNREKEKNSEKIQHRAKQVHKINSELNETIDTRNTKWINNKSTLKINNNSIYSCVCNCIQNSVKWWTLSVDKQTKCYLSIIMCKCI